MKGVRPLKNGTLQAHVTIHDRFYSEVFPAGTLPSVLKEWREAKRAEVKFGHKPAPAGGKTFAMEAADYLVMCGSMPTLDTQTRHINKWVEVFGPRLRSSITSAEIRLVLERWHPHGRDDGGPLANGTLNKRRTALMAMYTKLDGRGAVNVVKDTDPYPEDDAADEERNRPIPEWYRWLARMGRKPRKGRRRENRGLPIVPSKTQARLRVMLWTGLPQAQIGKLKPTDVDWDNAQIKVARRKKGKGAKPRWLHLIPQAVTALKAFVKADAWGTFDTSAMHSTLQRAWESENAWRAKWGHAPLPPVRPYDARHTFGTLMAMSNTDDRALQHAMLHGTAAQSARYTKGATDQRLLAARDALARMLNPRGVPYGDEPLAPTNMTALKQNLAIARSRGRLGHVDAGQSKSTAMLRRVK